MFPRPNSILPARASISPISLSNPPVLEFTAPEVNGRSIPSDWLIRFEFSQSGTQVFPRQTAP